MLFKKKLARFYREILREKGKNVKFLAQDMETYISQKQAEVTDYRDYLNQAFNRLVQQKIEEYENAKELFEGLCNALLNYSQCHFEICLLGKQKQEVFTDHKVCEARKQVILAYQKDFGSAIGECKELLQLLESYMNDTMYNYLILYHNQDLLGIEADQIEEYAKNAKYADLQRSLHINSSDRASNIAWSSAKTVEEELNLYRMEAEQLRVIKRQLYNKIEDCKDGMRRLKEVNNNLHMKMEELKRRQQTLQNKRYQLQNEAQGIWRDYISKSKVCLEYDYQISDNLYQMELLQKDINEKKKLIDHKNAELEEIKSAQSCIKSKRDTLIEENKFDSMMYKTYKRDVEKITDKIKTNLGIAASARERKKKLCYEHKCLAQTVRDIKNSHTYDPGFSDKISRLNSLKSYIDKATCENDTYMGYVKTYDREKEEAIKHREFFKEKKNRSSEDIEKYKHELDSLSEDYREIKGEIDLLYAQIGSLKEKKKPYYEKIKMVRNQKNAYLDSQSDKFKELIGICHRLLEG